MPPAPAAQLGDSIYVHRRLCSRGFPLSRPAGPSMGLAAYRLPPGRGKRAAGRHTLLWSSLERRGRNPFARRSSRFHLHCPLAFPFAKLGLLFIRFAVSPVHLFLSVSDLGRASSKRRATKRFPHLSPFCFAHAEGRRAQRFTARPPPQNYTHRKSASTSYESSGAARVRLTVIVIRSTVKSAADSNVLGP